MAITEIKTLKNWFKNLAKPTQEQFWAWMDSFWHKNEKIPLSSIANIEALLENNNIDNIANYLLKDGSNLDDENRILLLNKLKVLTYDYEKNGELISGTGYTKTQVDALIENLELGDGTNVDLTPYYTAEEVDANFAAKNHTHLEFTSIQNEIDALNVVQDNDFVVKYDKNYNKGSYENPLSGVFTEQTTPKKLGASITIFTNNAEAPSLGWRWINKADYKPNEVNKIYLEVEANAVQAIVLANSKSSAPIREFKHFKGTYNAPLNGNISIDNTDVKVGDEWIITHQGDAMPSITTKNGTATKYLITNDYTENEINRIYLHLVRINGTTYEFDVIATKIEIG